MPGLATASQKTPFNYEPEKIEPGTMYVYELSTNPDDFQLDAKSYYYIRSSKGGIVHIENILRDTSNPSNVNYREFNLNLNYMMLQSMSFQSLQPKEEIPIGTTWEGSGKTNFQEKTFNLEHLNHQQEGMQYRNRNYEFSHLPTFFYLTGHVDFWTVMRFYPYQKKEIEVWNYTQNDLTGVKVKYQGKESLKVPAGKIRTHKFEMSGKGILALLFGKKAWLWMNEEDGRNFMVRYRNNNRRSSSMPVIDLRLARVEKVSEKKWENKVDGFDTGNMLEESEISENQ